MNQTVTVNISGIVFHIEVDAYEKLKNYLNKIRSYFKNSEECNEIMADIESRIAELFNQNINSESQVISSKEVEEVITIMGKPEQYLDEDEEEQSNYKSEKTFRSAKKLFRDSEDRMLGGVASGISLYFGVASVWLRLFFILALFFGFGFLLYIVLWIIIPEAKTASEKLQMRGEPINFENIGKTIEEEAERVGDSLKKNGQQYGKKAETAFEAFFSFIFQLLKGFVKILGKIFGVLFIAIGTFWMIVLIGMLFGSDAILSITSDGIFSIDSNEFFDIIFNSENQFQLAFFGILLMIGIPFITLIYAGSRLLFKYKSHFSVGLGLFVFWIIGVAICGTVGVKIASELAKEESSTHIQVINNEVDDFYINAGSEDSPGTGILEDEHFFISADDNSIYMNDIRLYIYKSKSDSMELEVIKNARGKSKKDAVNNAKMITYNYTITDSLIGLGNYLSVARESKIRGQEVKIKLYLPVGKSIYLNKSLKRIIHNVDNVTNSWDHDMLGERWVMLEDGLTCLDCYGIDGISKTELDSIRTFVHTEE